MTFDSAPTYNSDGNNTYQATVQVSDGTASDSQEITVSVTEQSTSSNASDLFISEYAEGSSNNKYLEIFNATGSSVNLDDYTIRSKVNGTNIFYNDYFESNYTLEDRSIYVICHQSADQSILDKCNFTTQYLSNGDDTYQLGKGDESNFQVIDTIGDYGDDPGDGWDVWGY